jgi:hypothetical protein
MFERIKKLVDTGEWLYTDQCKYNMYVSAKENRKLGLVIPDETQAVYIYNFVERYYFVGYIHANRNGLLMCYDARTDEFVCRIENVVWRSLILAE